MDRPGKKATPITKQTADIKPLFKSVVVGVNTSIHSLTKPGKSLSMVMGLLEPIPDLPELPMKYVFRMWEEVGELRETPHMYEENTQIPQKEVSAGI